MLLQILREQYSLPVIRRLTHDNINLVATFLSKYDSNGNRQWTQQFGTSINDYGSRLVIDNNNNIFLIGETLVRWTVNLITEVRCIRYEVQFL